MSTEERGTTMKYLKRGITFIASLFALLIVSIVFLFSSKSAQIKVDYYKDSEAIKEYQNRIDEKEIVVKILFDSMTKVQQDLFNVSKSKRSSDSIIEVKTNTIKQLNAKLSNLSDSLYRIKRTTRVSDLEPIKR